MCEHMIMIQQLTFSLIVFLDIHLDMFVWDIKVGKNEEIELSTTAVYFKGMIFLEKFHFVSSVFICE